MDTPNSKVTDGALGGAVAAMTAGAVQMIWMVQMPPGMEGGLAVLVGFGIGYAIKERRA